MGFRRARLLERQVRASVFQGRFGPNKAAGADALTSLTNLTNHMVAGLAPRELAPSIAGVPLVALFKADGGPLKTPRSFSVPCKLVWRRKVAQRPQSMQSGGWRQSL